MATESDMAATIEEIKRHGEQDAMTKPVATNHTVAPWSSEALTTEWLTGALCGDVAGAEVIDLELGEIDDGSNARQPVRVRYNEAGREAGLPERMFAKSTPRWEQRVIVGLTGSAFQEWGFYRDLRPSLGEIESPHGMYGVIDQESFRSIILIEDVADRVAQWGNPVELHIDRQRAESMVDLLASIHGPMWDNPKLDELSWLRTSQAFQNHLNATVRFEEQTLVGIDRAQERGLGAPEFFERRDEVLPALSRSLEMNVADVQTLLHFDVHLNNWYLAKSGHMGIMDWGCVSRGNWAADFAYMVMAALDVDDRRAWERELLERYLSRVSEHGVAPPNLDQAWLQYRQQTFHGLTFWLMTIGFAGDTPEMQADEICTTLVDRMCHAVHDLGSFDALSEAP